MCGRWLSVEGAVTGPLPDDPAFWQGKCAVDFEQSSARHGGLFNGYTVYHIEVVLEGRLAKLLKPPPGNVVPGPRRHGRRETQGPRIKLAKRALGLLEDTTPTVAHKKICDFLDKLPPEEDPNRLLGPPSIRSVARYFTGRTRRRTPAK